MTNPTRIEPLSSSPQSAAHWLDPFVIALCVIVTYVLLKDTTLSNNLLSIAMVGVVMLVMVPIELARSPALRVPRPDVPFMATLKRSMIKILGVFLGLGFLFLIWEFIPEYKDNLYKPFFETMPYVLPYLPFIIVFCVVWTEWRLGPAEDYAWQFGLIVLQRFKEIDWVVFRNGIFGWIVRGFFLPINVGGVAPLLKTFRGKETQLLTSGWPEQIDMLNHMIFALLVISIIPGYLFGLRLLNTTIKKVDQTWFGWGVTLLCYPPMSRGTGVGWFLFYTNASVLPWVSCFGAEGVGSYVVGSILLLTYFIHFWAESIFCLRSSHLTNRGVITNGPFRFCKHPVYVIKCIAWGIIYLPFLAGHGVISCISLTVCYLAFCGVYVLRSWIEERILSTDPDYIAYALWMDEHSLFRCVGQKIPWMSFAGRLQKWNKLANNI